MHYNRPQEAPIDKVTSDSQAKPGESPLVIESFEPYGSAGILSPLLGENPSYMREYMGDEETQRIYELPDVERELAKRSLHQVGLKLVDLSFDSYSPWKNHLPRLNLDKVEPPKNVRLYRGDSATIDVEMYARDDVEQMTRIAYNYAYLGSITTMTGRKGEALSFHMFWSMNDTPLEYSSQTSIQYKLWKPAPDHSPDLSGSVTLIEHEELKTLATINMQFDHVNFYKNPGHVDEAVRQQLLSRSAIKTEVIKCGESLTIGRNGAFQYLFASEADAEPNDYFRPAEHFSVEVMPPGHGYVAVSCLSDRDIDVRLAAVNLKLQHGRRIGGSYDAPPHILDESPSDWFDWL